MNGLENLLAARPLQALAVSPGEVLMVDHASGERHVLTPEVVDALACCDRFDTLAGHREHLLEALPELRERAQAVLPVLQGLAQRGLLQNADEVLSRLPRGLALPAVAPVCLLLAPGESLQPNPASSAALVQLARLTGGANLLCEEAEDAFAWRAVLDGAQLPVTVWSAVERTAWLAELADADSAGLLQALAGAGPGNWRARQSNFALLRASGQRLLLLEADQLGNPVAVAGVRAGLDPAASAARDAWFSADGASDLGEAAWSSALDWCGRGIGDLLGAQGPFSPTADSLQGLTWDAVARLAGGKRLKGLIFGSAGVIDSPHNRWIYTLGSQSRERLWQADYPQARQGRGLLHGMSQARLLHGLAFAPALHWVDPACGFDGPLAANGHLLRGAFGQLLDGGSCQLHLPWCLPRGDRSAMDRVAAGRAVHWPDLNRLLADWALSEGSRCQAEGPQQRARWWAAQLRDLAAAPAASLRERLSAYASQAQAQLIGALQFQLESTDSVPTVWRDDIVAIVEAQAKALLGNAAPRLDGYGEDDAVSRFASELRQTADCSEQWPVWLQRAAERRD